MFADTGCRDNEPVLHRSVRGGDAGQDVQRRLPGLLRVDVQSLRLVRRCFQHRRGDIHVHGHHAASRGQRAALCATSSRLQSHQVSNIRVVCKHWPSYVGALRARAPPPLSFLGAYSIRSK